MTYKLCDSEYRFMTHLTFSPYVCSESSDQRASAPERR